MVTITANVCPRRTAQTGGARWWARVRRSRPFERSASMRCPRTHFTISHGLAGITIEMVWSSMPQTKTREAPLLKILFALVGQYCLPRAEFLQAGAGSMLQRRAATDA